MPGSWLAPWRRLGKVGGLALLLGLLALALALGLLPQQHEAVQAQREQLQSLRKAAAAPKAALSPAQAFAASLPPEAQRAERVARLLTLASLHGLQGPRAEFSERRLPGATELPLLQLQLQLSAQASYPVLRQFTQAALAADPGLTLERLRLRRSEPGQTELQAEFRWVLHMHSAAPPPPALKERTS